MLSVISNRVAILLVISVFCCLGTRAGLADDSVPQFEKTTLVIGDDVRQPIANDVFTGLVLYSGNTRVFSDEESVVIRNIETGSEQKLPHEKGRKWALAKIHDGVAYVVSLPKWGSGRNGAEIPRVRRLDVEKGSWLEDLEIELGGNKSAEVAGVYADDDYFLVAIVLSDEEVFPEPRSFWVGCFEMGKSKPKWKRSFSGKESQKIMGEFSFSYSRPDYVDTGLRVFSRLEDRVLFCPEGKQPIRCLNIDTGTELWTRNRVWEFQRGFIGPSVYEYYIDRFRIDSSFGLNDRDQAKLDAEKTKFDNNFTCSIVGGPIIVKLKNNACDHRRGAYSVFIAVSKYPKNSLYGNLGQCVVYELNENGKVLSMTSLPQMVSGSKFQVIEDVCVWQCFGSQLVKLEASCDMEQKLFGRGWDCQTGISWIRTVKSSKKNATDAWLTADVDCHNVELLEGFAIGVTDGGYIKKKKDALYHFPISITNLETGKQVSLELKVPFTAPIPSPRSNYRKSGDNYEADGTYMLGIKQLSVIDDRLEFVFWSRGEWRRLEFEFSRKDLFGLFDLKEPVEAAKEKIEVPEGLTLLDVANDPDSKRIEILLARGADINKRSSNGWSALMNAACYGCLETVEVLIKNGANVDFADKNCGGQTTLMWAAKSDRSPKRKVKALIGAGANIFATTDAGGDLLMSAAGAGNIEIVELLLEKGMKPNAKNKNGYTPLMAAAAREGSPKICKLLIAVGAEVDAVDTRGRTALVYAANGYGEGETLKTLLDAGADPNRKDNKGRVALDRCKESNNSFGAEKRGEILREAMSKEK